ncbi:hypothetical protein P9112_009769 [Eukaryota sp. TZLM1-RC]
MTYTTQYASILTLPDDYDTFMWPLHFLQSTFLHRCQDLEIEVSIPIWRRFTDRFSFSSKTRCLDFTSTGFGESSFTFFFSSLPSLPIANQLYAINLSDNPISDTAASSVSSFLSTHPSRLSVLLLRGCGLSPIASASIIESLTSNPFLLHLDLSSSSTGVRNHLGQASAQHLATLLSFNHLRTLNLSGCGLGRHVALLVPQLTQCSSIRKLFLSSNALGDVAFVIHELSKCFRQDSTSGLAHLDLSRNRFSQECWKAVGNLVVKKEIELKSVLSVSVGDGLKYLNLSDNTLTNDGEVVQLAANLPGNLEEFSLNNVSLNDELFELLLPRILKIKVLSLARNNLTDSAISSLKRSFLTPSTQSNVISLDLSRNKLRIPSDLPFLVVESGVKHLNLADNNIRDSVVVEIAQYLDKLSSSCQLEELNLSSNAVKILGAEMLSDVMPKVTSLKRIKLRANDVTSKILDKIDRITEEKSKRDNLQEISRLSADIERLVEVRSELPELEIRKQQEEYLLQKHHNKRVDLHSKIEAHKSKMMARRDHMTSALASAKKFRSSVDAKVSDTLDHFNERKADHQDSINSLLNKMEKERKLKNQLEKSLRTVRTQFEQFQTKANEDMVSLRSEVSAQRTAVDLERKRVEKSNEVKDDVGQVASKKIKKTKKGSKGSSKTKTKTKRPASRPRPSTTTSTARRPPSRPKTKPKSSSSALSELSSMVQSKGKKKPNRKPESSIKNDVDQVVAEEEPTGPVSVQNFSISDEVSTKLVVKR